MHYSAPVADMRVMLDSLADLPGLSALPGYEEVDAHLVDAVLDEAAKLAGQVIAPTNRDADLAGATLENGVVRTAPGYADAYRQFCDGGWNGLGFDPEHGGQGLPWALNIAVQEMVQAASLSFGLCPLLTHGAIELLSAHGSPDQKTVFLENLISGRWTGTMNLTEPQAGSDLALLRTKAVAENGHYRINGQKIYITWGDHDCAENIVHMVLARTPDAPPGVKGISLFIVPKFLPRPDGTPGERNDLRPLSLERKLGIHASPTAVMSFGEGGTDQGAVGFLVGEENRGLEYMFTMMNNARLSVAVQGVGIAERATQQAVAYANERVQGRRLGDPSRQSVPIVNHPDVRRMLLGMKADTAAARGLVYYTAGLLDRAKKAPEAADRAAALRRVELLTPVAKAWCTDTGVTVASVGVQVHGGSGFIEDTGAAQHYRDARILPIYEGTNGIQALDLAVRKLQRDGGSAMRDLLQAVEATAGSAAEAGDPNTAALGQALRSAGADARRATDWLVETGAADPERAAAGAAPYLDLIGTLVGGWSLVRVALTDAPDPGTATRRIALARFFAAHRLPATAARAHAIVEGAAALSDLPAGLLE